jgi:hypothetical protein
MTDFTSLQLRKLDSDEIPFVPLATDKADFRFYSPVPDWLPTDEEIAQAFEDRRREKARELSAQFSPKVK